MMEELRRALEWFGGRDTGLSSKAIALHMTTGKCDGSTPSDPADLGRCLRLLALFPQWSSRLPEMAKYNTTWAAMSARWSEMADCMLEEVGIDWAKGQRAEKTYALMKEVRGGR